LGYFFHDFDFLMTKGVFLPIGLNNLFDGVAVISDINSYLFDITIINGFYPIV